MKRRGKMEEGRRELSQQRKREESCGPGKRGAAAIGEEGRGLWSRERGCSNKERGAVRGRETGRGMKALVQGGGRAATTGEEVRQ